MLYRFLREGEIIDHADLLFSREYINYQPAVGKLAICDHAWLRAVPEPRPVEDLTEEEREELISIYNKFYEKDDWDVINDGLIELLKRADEIRSRPRESAKEKWIREQLANVGDTIGMTKEHYKRQLDAAYEAGRGER